MFPIQYQHVLSINNNSTILLQWSDLELATRWGFHIQMW